MWWQQIAVYATIKLIDHLANRAKKMPADTSNEELLMKEARARVIRYKEKMEIKKKEA